MMKRAVQAALTCTIVLSVISTAAAQQEPVPVVRMGDWVEIGDDVFVNFIGQTRIHYQWTHNYDFESDIRDRTPSRSNSSTVAHDGDGDLSFQEPRLGADFRYRKNLRMRVLLENQMTWDGNLIDNALDLNGTGPETQTFRDGNDLTCDGDTGNCIQRNTINLERAWIEYQIPNTPLTFDAGARIRFYDPARMLGDDDPGVRLVGRFGPNRALRLAASALLQTESLRLGLQNDNDDAYYVFEGSYDWKPYQIGLSVAYFRFRFDGASGQTRAGAKLDSVLVQPYVTGTFGPFRALLQPMFVFGSADSNNATKYRLRHSVLWVYRGSTRELWEVPAIYWLCLWLGGR